MTLIITRIQQHQHPRVHPCSEGEWTDDGFVQGRAPTVPRGRGGAAPPARLVAELVHTARATGEVPRVGQAAVGVLVSLQKTHLKGVGELMKRLEGSFGLLGLLPATECSYRS